MQINKKLKYVFLLFFFFSSMINFSCSFPFKKKIIINDKPENLLAQLTPRIETFQAKQKIRYIDQRNSTILEQNIFFHNNDGLIIETKDFFGSVASSLFVGENYYVLSDFRAKRNVKGNKNQGWLKDLLGFDINIDLIESALFRGKSNLDYDSLSLNSEEPSLNFYKKTKLVGKINFDSKKMIMKSFVIMTEKEIPVETIYYKRYKRTNGILFPYSLHYVNMSNKIKVKIEFRGVKINEKISNKLFDLEKYRMNG